MMVEVFDDVFDALDFIDQLVYEADGKDVYLKIEIWKTSDHRWRVGVYNEGQMELDI